MKNKPLYVAIDSDVLRNIVHLNILKNKYGRVDIEKIDNIQLKNDFNFFSRLLDHVRFDEVRLLIVDAVYQESKHSQSLVNFIKEYCYFPNINAVNYQEKAEKARILARAYCSKYEHEGKICEPPMKFMFVADINKTVPTNDAYIMAQATVEGCCVLTGNRKDFIFDEKADTENHDRLAGICYINILNGYFEENEHGVFTSKPITLSTLAGRLRRDGKIGIIEQKKDKIKADRIL